MKRPPEKLILSITTLPQLKNVFVRHLFSFTVIPVTYQSLTKRYLVRLKGVEFIATDAILLSVYVLFAILMSKLFDF